MLYSKISITQVHIIIMVPIYMLITNLCSVKVSLLKLRLSSKCPNLIEASFEFK